MTDKHVAPHATRLSVEEWAALPEDEPGEWVDGRLVEEEMPDLIHEVVVAWLITQLTVWLDPRGGIVAGSEARFGVAAGRGRKPDLFAYFPGTQPPPRGLIRVPPDIMVEVISPLPRDVRRDRVAKMDEYAAFGVHYYWLVDPQIRTIEIFERDDTGHYRRLLGAQAGTLDTIPGCDGLRLDLDALWAKVARLSPEEEPAPGGGIEGD